MNVYEIVTDRIVSQLEKGIIPWKKPWIGVRDYAYSRKTGKPYSLLNQLMLDRPGEYLTFDECSKCGGRIKKGEKSSIVVFWRIYDKQTVNAKGEPAVEHIPLLRYINVFNIDQCEGIEPKYKQEELNEFDPIEEAERVVADYIARSGVKLTNSRQDRAFYRPSDDSISLPLKEQFADEPSYYATAFHEMAHSTGHESRLARLAKDFSFGDHEYSKEELVAEIASAAMMNRLNIETEQTVKGTNAYVTGWLRKIKGDSKFIVSAAGKAEKAVEYITGEQEDAKKEAAA